MPSPPASVKILVIDDVQLNLTVFSKVVTQIPGTEAVCFTSSREALAWCATNDPALILVDQNMPELSGLEFISEVRERGLVSTPIVMITGTADKELQREALKRGAVAFLNKPVDPVAFVSLARNIMALRGARFDAMAKAGAAQADQNALGEAVLAGERNTFESLAKIIDMRDTRLGDHCRRVALYSEAIGRRMGFSLVEREQLARAASIHDIGKIATPDRILGKPGRLVGDERGAAKRHVTDAVEMLAPFTTPLLKLAAEIAHYHHERYDGSGYPVGLLGVAIPPFARVVAVADTFSALTSRRPWREAAAVGLAVDQIEKEAGFGFEPKVVAAFRDAMPDLLDIRAEVPDLAPAR